MLARCVCVFFILACQHHGSDVVVVSDSTAMASVIDAATVSRCVVSYTCGMSHPGLGTWSQSTSIDLATCAGTASTHTGAFEPPLGNADASSDTSNTAAVSPERCARLRDLVIAITDKDARQQESAQVDMQACSLTVTCRPDAAPKISVQRQTTTGSSRIEQLIRAVQAR